MEKRITKANWIPKKIIKMNQKGALFIEYAFILAFILVAGLTLTGSNSIGSGVASIFSKTSAVLDVTKKPGGLEEKLKQYAAALSSSVMIHSGTQDKETGTRYYSLGKEFASGAHEPNFGDKLREAGIEGAYVYQGMNAAYGKLSEEDKSAFRENHYLESGSSPCSLIVSTDGNNTWENGKSYNAVQYMTYQIKKEGKETQVVGSYRNIFVNVDAKGNKTYADTAGNSIDVRSAANDGGGWQKFNG